MVNQTNLLQPNLSNQQIQAQVGGVVRQQQPYQPVVSAYATQPVLDPRVMLQPGFSNTGVEQVRLSNQSSQAQAGGFLGPQAFVPQQHIGLQPVSQVIGPQQLSPSVMLQPGFAGTSVDQVIQSNQQSQANAGGYLGPQAFVPQQQIGLQHVPQVIGPQPQWSQAYTQLTPSVMLQPGFTNTNVEQVRLSNQISQANAGGYLGPQAFVPQQQIGLQQVPQWIGPQQMLQPGFAGTSVDQVIQSNQRSQANAGGFYGPQAIVQQQPQQQILAYVPQTQQPIYQPIVR